MKQIFVCIFIFVSTNLFSQNEPWKRPLKICTGINGNNFFNIQTFQDSSGVPNVIRLSSGNLACVFQWFRQPIGSLSWDKVAVKFSSDEGITWTQPVPIVVTDLPFNFTRPFDPTLAVSDNGRIRIFFSDGLSMMPDTSVNTYSAISDDGINYTMEPGVRFSLPDRPVLDPAVIKFKNQWHLVNPNSSGGTGAYHNVSPDGINFTRVPDIVSDISHSWIGNFMIQDTNELRFYGSGMNIWYSSSTNGGVWSSFTNTNITGGDPAVIKISDSGYIMIYTGQPYPSLISEKIKPAEAFTLYQNYPNPFNPSTVISYRLTVNGHVVIKVYDIKGNELKTLINKKQNPGLYEINFSGADLPGGIYFYQIAIYSDKLQAGNFREVKKMVIVK